MHSKTGHTILPFHMAVDKEAVICSVFTDIKLINTPLFHFKCSVLYAWNTSIEKEIKLKPYFSSLSLK